VGFTKTALLLTTLFEPRRPGSLRIIALALLLAIGAAAWGSGSDRPPSLAQPERTGEELVTRYTTLVANKDIAGLEGFLSDAFIIQRANGVFHGKGDYLANLPGIKNFKIADVTARQDGGTLIVRWTLSVGQVADGVRFSAAPAPRLSTFAWKSGQWKLAAHANFNVPAPESQ
jgi:hypothetical protein